MAFADHGGRQPTSDPPDCEALSNRLRNFTRAGIFERKQFPEIPPHVEYHFTEFEKKFLRLLKEIEKLKAALDKNSRIRSN